MYKGLYGYMLKDKALLAETEAMKNKYKIKAKNYDSRHIKVKLIDRFNYVIHINFVLDKNDFLIDYHCDYGEQCNEQFCSHCLVAYKYITEQCNRNIFFNDSPQTDNDKIAMIETSEKNSIEETVNCCCDDVLTIENNENKLFEEPMSVKAVSTEYESKDAEKILEETKDSLPELNAEPRQMKILFGTDVNTDEPVYLLPNNTDYVLNNNIGIIGTMGTGKTQFTKSLITQLHIHQHDNYDGTPIGILIFDYKGDYNESKADFVSVTNANVIRPYKIKYNPFALNYRKHKIPLMPLHVANTFTDTISRIYNLGSKQTNILLESIIEAYRQQGILPEYEGTWNKPAPTFEQVYNIYEKSSAGNIRDSLSAIMNKLHNFVIFEPDPFKTISLTELLKGIVVIDISEYDEDIQSLVVAITLDQFYSQMQAAGSSMTDGKYRQLRTFILVDEADNIMKMGLPSLKKILKEGREFGVGTILSTQSLTHFCGSNDDYSKYMITWVIHNVSDLNRRDVEFVLKQQQKSEELEKLFMSIKALKKHESVVKIFNDNPLMIRDKPFWQLYNEILGRN